MIASSYLYSTYVFITGDDVFIIYSLMWMFSFSIWDLRILIHEIKIITDQKMYLSKITYDLSPTQDPKLEILFLIFYFLFQEIFLF